MPPTIQMPASLDIADLIVASKIGQQSDLTRSWAVYIGEEPSEEKVANSSVRKGPANVITVYDFPTQKPDYAINDLGTDYHVGYPGVQVRVRATDYVSGYRRLARIVSILANKGKFETDDWRYMNVEQTTEITPLGVDDRSRQIFVVSFKTYRTPKNP